MLRKNTPQSAAVVLLVSVLVWANLRTPSSTASGSRIENGFLGPSLDPYLHQHCSAYKADHTALVTAALRPYVDGISARDIPKRSKWPPNDSPGSVAWWRAQHSGSMHPVVFVLNGTLHLHPSAKDELLHNGRYFFLPTLRKAAELVRLPDMVLSLNPGDQPSVAGADFESRVPWLGYCNHRQQSTDLLFPDTLAETYISRPSTDRAGPGDDRKAKAVFLGSPTGWAKGRRRAVCMASVLHPDLVYAGLSSFPAEESQLVNAVERKAFEKPKMELQAQINEYKYIVNVDGHCAALRLRHLLSSDSAVMWVESPEEEWYYPLLVPFKHFIPVEYDPLSRPYDAGLNLADMVQWAERHPEQVAQIVRSANEFADFHLSERGRMCYVLRLLQHYQKLLADVQDLPDLVKHMQT
ncbi:hypothetical protein WJX72_008578 [[Myrmecia] bisecta]|uniref:Glycosyl transferase CAP10 domain-containing protein n=1 Tax=[Myrmecia] bisecta TaxID=41462 RepID=A0AAW1R8D2_9CHLO